MTGSQRKLATILAADAAGYSRLMGDDEKATERTLTEYRQVFIQHIGLHQGRIVDTAGDSVLAVFDSPVEAVECAAEIQRELARRNRQLAEHRRMQFRIGLNLGDVITHEDGTIYGDGVNIAARLQSIAEPGGICISANVFEQVDGRLPLKFTDLGHQQVKNIPKPVRVYRVIGREQVTSKGATWTFATRRRATSLLIAIVALAAAAGGWYAARSRSVSDPVLAMPAGPSIAVLPFSNLSGDPTQEYIADGITEQIITELSRFRNLLVIARNSTFTYKGRAVDVRQVGRELGARYIVEGSVQRSGDIVRVTVQLLDANRGAHLWAETYERNLRDAKVFGVQDDITRRVASAIGDAYGVLSLTTFDQSASSEGTSSLDAYECVLRSYAYERVMSPKEHAAVRDCLERAVKLDPKYAEAWASLAEMYVQEYSQGFNIRPDPLSRAIEAAQRAIQLDPGNQQAHIRLASAQFFRHDIPAFTGAADRAIALNPNSADALAWAGIFVTYAYQEDPARRARGVAMMRKAMAMNPFYPSWYHFPIAWDYYYNGQYEEALAEARKLNMPEYYWTRAVLATIYGALGRREDAKPEITALLQLFPDFPKKMREETRKWNTPEAFIKLNVANLRRAGLEIPEE